MKQRMRDSGIPVLGEVSWGTHLCFFYQDKSELEEITVPYFRRGLLNNEKCIWVCSKPLCVDDAIEALAAGIPDVHAFIASGQMQVFSYDQWYLGSENRFREEEVVARWKDSVSTAIEAGYDGLRVSGNTSWIDGETWETFRNYEETLYGSIAHEPMLTICCYPRSGAWVPDVVDVVRSHQRAIINRGPGWEVINCGGQSEKQWEYLFDEIPEGILVTDESGNILVANDTALSYFGVSALEDLGGSVEELARRFSLQPQAAGSTFTIPCLSERGPSPARRWFASRRGVDYRLDLLVHAREIERTSISSRRYLVLIQDLTEIRAFERMRDRAMNILAHELRNPLQVLKTAVPLLSSSHKGDAASAARYVATIRKQVDHLSKLVEDLSTSSRSDFDRLEMTPGPSDLTSLVNEEMESIMPASEHRIVTLYRSDLKIPIYGDGVRIRQILTNLLSNAVKYTPAGKRIWVDVRADGGRALLTVEDEGIGIPKGEIDLVFRAFYRATNASPTCADGMGLGLYISRQLARLHGGDLWAEERPGGGTIMSLSLPLYSDDRSGDPGSRLVVGQGTIDSRAEPI